MKKKSLKINFIMNLILSMSVFIFPLITFPYVSRILKPEGMGKVSFATSLVTYFNMIAQLGIPVYGIRACAKVRDDKEKLTRTVQELFFINLCMCVVAYILFLIAITFVPRLQGEKALYIIVSTTILLNAIGMEWLYKALEQYTYITIRSIVFKFLALVLMFMLVQKKEDYIIYGALTILAASASNIFNFCNLHKYISMRPVGKYYPQKHIKSVIIFFAMTCASTIYTNLDTVILGFMKTNQDVGYYNAAVKIKIILVNLITSLGAVLLPRSSYYVEHNLLDEFKRISTKALNFVFIIAIPTMVYFVIFAKQSIYFLSGKEYFQSIQPMQILMPTILFIGITNILGIQMLIPLGHEKIVLCAEIAGAVIDLVMNAILIPKFASSGAAIGTVLAEMIVFIVEFTYLKNIVIDSFKKVQYTKILIATLIGSIASILILKLEIGNFATLVMSAIVFFGIYGCILLFGKEPLVCEIVGQFVDKIRRKSSII